MSLYQYVICLDEGVLAVQQIMRRDFLARNNVNEGPYNDRNRQAAYVQFILWQHGRFGVGHMVFVPSCCVWAIREKYSNALGHYTGFIPGRL